VNYAFAHNEFYRWYYAEHGFAPSALRAFDDIAQVPIVTKSALRAWKLSRRSSSVPGRLLVNTGGTSGQPLEFYLSRQLFARDWAHLHAAWRRLDYHQTDLKLTFRGNAFRSTRALKFRAIHNEFAVSAYHPQEVIAAEVRELVKRRTVRFLHGYPSTVYQFAAHCAAAATDVRDVLRATLRGVFLGSEYPAPSYRERIESTFGVPCLSWYGHSEMAVFAYEKAHPFVYSPMHTYGYAEAIRQADGEHHLIGTSYDNKASPFVRYDTGDSVEPVTAGGILETFRIASGRVGDYIVDRHGRQVSLTAMVFGRHHAAFGMAEFIQVRQNVPGHATIVIVPTEKNGRNPTEWASLFDFRGVDVDLDFEVVSHPHRTSAGKTPLLVRT
jgi:phenylacetate-CoA ligase